MTTPPFNQFDPRWFEEPNYSKQGHIDYKCNQEVYKLWYGKVGIEKKLPLLVLHGGPGGSHSNLVSLQALAFEREVIFYDQLGCGYSDKPDDKSLWNIDRYIEELKIVVDSLKLRKFHLLGHSWGGMLATAFAHKYFKGMASLSLMSPILDMPRYIKGTRIKLRNNLSPGFTKIIDDFEKKDTGDPKKYKKALFEHLEKHICKLFPNPPEVLTRLSHLSHKQVHDEMIGHNCTSELNILGNLKNVDVSPLVNSIRKPILFSCGDFECCPPKDVGKYYRHALDAKFHVFNNCRHMTMLESPVEFLNIVQEFISEYDRSQKSIL